MADTVVIEGDTESPPETGNDEIESAIHETGVAEGAATVEAEHAADAADNAHVDAMVAESAAGAAMGAVEAAVTASTQAQIASEETRASNDTLLAAIDALPERLAAILAPPQEDITDEPLGILPDVQPIMEDKKPGQSHWYFKPRGRKARES